MENKIPTAEEFVKGKSDSFDNQMRRNTFSKSSVIYLMQQFAKLHVEAALKSAVENVQLETFYDPIEECPYESVVDSSILNAYPEENIR